MDYSPKNIVHQTSDMSDNNADVADQADRLTMIMEAEGARNGALGVEGEFGGEGSLDGYSYPLENMQEVLAMEDAEDSSDDPMHAGGLNPSPWMPAETTAMHVMGENQYADDESDAQRADPNFDQYEGTISGLTPEDQTLMGIDPYED